MFEIYDQKYVKNRGGIWRWLRKLFLYPVVLKLVKPEKDDSILEIGCEKGDLIKMFKKFSKKVVGIDINKEMIDELNDENLFFMSAEKLEFSDQSFDKVVSSHTIEHIADLKKFFSEVERVLKPGGMCILVYPFELIRGISVIFNAWQSFKNPFFANKIHLHRLWPEKLKKFTSMKMIKRGIFFRPITFDFYTIFQKEE